MRIIPIARNVIVVGMAVIWLQACNVAPRKTPIEPPPSSPARQQARAIRPSTAPVAALMHEARNERRARHPERAVAKVERALRIDPYNPKLWHMLAAIRLGQGNAAQAEIMATKSMGLASNNAALQAANWRIIAQARRLRGDKPGAHRAEQRAGGYWP